MTESFELQLKRTELYLKREEKRKKDIEEKYKIMLKKVGESIKHINERIKILKGKIESKDNPNSKANSKNKEGIFCVGCGKKIKQGKYCDECRVGVERIRYQVAKKNWDGLSEEEKIKRMEKLSQSLLYEGKIKVDRREK